VARRVDGSLIRVSIVADSPSRGRAIADLLSDEDHIEVVELRSSDAYPDVVVATTGVDRDGLPPATSIVFLSDEEPAVYAEPGRAWLPPGVTAGELTAAVFAAAQDLIVLTKEQARHRLPGRGELGDQRGDFVESLTNRELQVLRMLANGLGNKEIAGQLGISDHTAKFHVGQILAKLGAGSRTEAVTIAIRRGLVPI
jgi:DNA-binding CsgD family transcriptional regulator